MFSEVISTLQLPLHFIWPLNNLCSIYNTQYSGSHEFANKTCYSRKLMTLQKLGILWNHHHECEGIQGNFLELKYQD